MSKDRLGELLKVRNKNEVNIDIESVSDVTTSGDVNLKKTFERAEVVGQWIKGTEKNVDEVRHYISKLADFSLNHKDLHDKIQSLFANNTSISHKINGKLKELEEEQKNANPNSAVGRIKSIQYNTLKIRYIKIFKQSNEELENFRNIQKANLEAQLRAKGVQVTDEELVALLEEKTDIQIFTENIIAETLEAKRVLADIEARHQLLLKIEQMLIEIRDLFLQMAILIDAQQELVDRVEYQAQLAKDFVGKTPRILRDAHKKKIKYLKCKIYCGIAFTVLIILILILLLK